MSLITPPLGRIYCRFAEDSFELQELGKLIRDKVGINNGTPVFSFHEGDNADDLCALDHNTVHDMARGKFKLRTQVIKVQNKLWESEIRFTMSKTHSYPISGFPRFLIDDDKENTSQYWGYFTRGLSLTRSRN